MISNTITALRNTTSLVAEMTVKSHTIEMRVDEQATGSYDYRKHYLIIDGAWDTTNRRNHKAAQAEYENIVGFWQDTDI